MAMRQPLAANLRAISAPRPLEGWVRMVFECVWLCRVRDGVDWGLDLGGDVPGAAGDEDVSTCETVWHYCVLCVLVAGSIF